MTDRQDSAAAWVYQGVWAVVVEWFKVPPDPPGLPTTGEPLRAIRPAPGFLRYLKFCFWVLLIPGDVLPLVGWFALFLAIPALALVLSPVLLVVLVLPDVIAYVGIHLRYDTTWYVFTDRSLRIRRGIWVIHETTISFENVQNVEVRQGPLQRYFGIADVLVQTAGGGSGHSSGKGSHQSTAAHVALLQGLDDAEAVRDAMLDRVRRVRSAGLGDEVAHLPPRDGSPLARSPAHLMVLREIRSATARLAGIG